MHDPDQLWGLCEAHERLAHLGLIENENLAPQFWKVRERADENDPKYEVDKVVQNFRKPK